MALNLPPWMRAQQHAKHSLKQVILAFWQQRLATHTPLFTFQQFLDFVESQVSCRPNSPGRILELLRKEGHINYEAVQPNFKNRRGSLYKAVPLDKRQ